MRRLLLVRHAATAATRAAAFPAADDTLDAPALAAAAALRPALPARCDAISSPAARCRQTATAAGLDARADERLAECDFGAWSSRTLAEVTADEPDAVARWLDDQARCEGAAVAITHGGVIKAALVRALGAPLDAFWRIDVAPLAITELHAHDGRWTVARANCPVGGWAR